MGKIPTVEQYLHDNYHPYYDEDNCPVYQEWQVREAMIEFAKMHVESALKAASENAEQKWVRFTEHDYEIDKDSILNSYPLSNIK